MSPVFESANLCRPLSGHSVKRTGPALGTIIHRPQERVRRRRIPVRSVLSHGVVKNTKHMDVQERVCACQLWLQFFAGCEPWPLVIEGNGIDWCPYTHAVSGVIRTISPGCVGPRRLVPPPSQPRGPLAKTRVHVDRCIQHVAFCMLGSSVDCGVAEWCRCRASRKDINHTTSVEYVTPLPT